MSTPVLFLDPESKNFERDFQFALLVFRGAMPREAATALKMRPGHGYQLLCRWRDKATQWAGQEISDTLILRLIVEPDRAKADFQKNLELEFQKMAKTGPVAKK